MIPSLERGRATDADDGSASALGLYGPLSYADAAAKCSALGGGLLNASADVAAAGSGQPGSFSLAALAGLAGGVAAGSAVWVAGGDAGDGNCTALLGDWGGGATAGWDLGQLTRQPCVSLLPVMCKRGAYACA